MSRRRSDVRAYPYPEAMRDLARRRCQPFIRHVMGGFGRREISLHTLIESCYMQGLCDAADALSRTPTPEPDHE